MNTPHPPPQILLLIILWLPLSASTWATLYPVGHGPEYTFQTITSALEQVVSGDTIQVASGVYDVSGGEVFPLHLKTGVSLVRALSGQPPVLKGLGLTPILHAERVTRFVLDGFVIQDGFTETKGGGIYLDSASGIIRNCRIAGNRAGGNGGGILCSSGSSPQIVNCLLTENIADSFGGGLYCEGGSSPQLSHCVISTNKGSGVGCTTTSAPRFRDCQIVGNFSIIGAGIYCADASPVFDNCRIYDNRSNLSLRPVAGALFATNSSLIFTNCLISGNFAGMDGGGIVTDFSDLLLINCLVAGNSANGKGGGLLLVTSSNSNFYNTLIVGNSAQEGGAFYTGSSKTRLSGCVLERNQAPLGSWLSTGEPLIGGRTSEITIANSIIRNGTDGLRNEDSSLVSILYSNFEGGAPGTGNLDQEPMFVSGSSGVWSSVSQPSTYNYETLLTAAPPVTWIPNQYKDRRALVNPNTNQNLFYPILGNTTDTLTVMGDLSLVASPGDPFEIVDYHLQAQSPCIDAGSNAFHSSPQSDKWSYGDFGQGVRVIDGNQDRIPRIDQGTFEYGNLTTIGDFNFDHANNRLDLFLFQQSWQQFPYQSGLSGLATFRDLNGDQQIDGNDLLIFERCWYRRNW
jgi:hypothetical protein